MFGFQSPRFPIPRCPGFPDSQIQGCSSKSTRTEISSAATFFPWKPPKAQIVEDLAWTELAPKIQDQEALIEGVYTKTCKLIRQPFWGHPAWDMLLPSISSSPPLWPQKIHSATPAPAPLLGMIPLPKSHIWRSALGKSFCGPALPALLHPHPTCQSPPTGHGFRTPWDTTKQKFRDLGWNWKLSY